MQNVLQQNEYHLLHITHNITQKCYKIVKVRKGVNFKSSIQNSAGTYFSEKVSRLTSGKSLIGSGILCLDKKGAIK